MHGEMPRLYHRKSSLGCIRCKKRKVKCDEDRPRCGACTKHAVACKYQRPWVPWASNSADQPDRSLIPQSIPTQRSSDESILEMRLVHYFVLYTARSFTSSYELWRQRGPLVAFRNRQVLDAIVALAALHLHRNALGARDSGDRSPTVIPAGYHPVTPSEVAPDQYLGQTSLEGMKQISLRYFQSAARGHREALQDVLLIDFEAAYMAAVLISFQTLVSLSEKDDDSKLGTPLDEKLWFQLGSGPRKLLWEGTAIKGYNVANNISLLHSLPNPLDDDELFHPENAVPFEALLSWGVEYEALNKVDSLAYQQALSYIGLVYKRIIDGSDKPLATSRRIIALPSKAPQRFVELVIEQRPRALTMLAFLYAFAKLASDGVAWYVGIAEQQIPSIHRRLPRAWKSFLDWPLAIAERASACTDQLPIPLIPVWYSQRGLNPHSSDDENSKCNDWQSMRLY